MSEFVRGKEGETGGAARALRTTSGCGVDAKDSGELEPSKVSFLLSLLLRRNAARTDGGSEDGERRLLLTSSSSLPSTRSSHEDTFSASSPSGLLGVYVLEM